MEAYNSNKASRGEEVVLVFLTLRHLRRAGRCTSGVPALEGEMQVSGMFAAGNRMVCAGCTASQDSPVARPMRPAAAGRLLCRQADTESGQASLLRWMRRAVAELELPVPAREQRNATTKPPGGAVTTKTGRSIFTSPTAWAVFQIFLFQFAKL